MFRIAPFIIGFALALTVSAKADQFLTVSDNSTLEGYVSAREITRLSLVGDRIVSIQKADSDEFGDDFNVAHDAVTGDIYITLPAVYEQPRLSFFITSKKGFSYRAHLAIRDTPATTIFVTNPGVGSEAAEAWELQTPFRATVVRLIRAMWTGSTIDGYDVRHSVDVERSAGPLKYRLVASYDGALLAGRVLKVVNTSQESIDLSEDAFFSPAVIAISVRSDRLAPRESALVYVVARKGG